MTPAELVARMFAAYENGGTMTESEFVEAVLAKYEVWDDDNAPAPSYEVILEWIVRDRLEARDYVEWRGRCQQAETKLKEREAEVGTLIADLARREEELATLHDDFRRSESASKNWRVQAESAAAELLRYHPCNGANYWRTACWVDTNLAIRHEATVYHKVAQQ